MSGLMRRIAVGHRECLAGFDRHGVAARVAVGCTASCQSVKQAVDLVLRIALLEAGVEHHLLVRHAGAGGVFGVEDLGSGDDEGPLVPGQHGCREMQTVEENGHLVEFTGPLGIFEDLDPPTGLALVVQTERIVAHLNDPEPAVGPEAEAGRAGDKWLSGHQLDLEARPHFNRRHRRLG